MNDDEMLEKIASRGFKTKEFVNHQIWIYSSFSATSLAFFLSLFSAGVLVDPSALLQACVFFFAVSLITNASLAFIIATFKDDPDLVEKVNLSKNFKFVPTLAWASFSLSVLLLIAFYSLVVALLFWSLSLLLYVLFQRAMKEIIDTDHEQHRLKRDRIKKSMED